MKKWIAIWLAAAMMLTAAGCGSNTEQPTVAEPPNAAEETLSVNNAEHSTAALPTDGTAGTTDSSQSMKPDGEPSTAPAQESADAPEAPPASSGQQPVSQPDAVSHPVSAPTAALEPDTPRVLIAYFTWADNTVVEDQDAAVQGALDHYESIGDVSRYEGVDATSSASVVVPGNAAKIAAWIQQEVGGDLFSIVVTEPYSSDYDECLDRAADEKASNARPELAGHVEGMEDYDIVFLGFPNWWYTLPMPVLSFVEEYDFSGKTIVPFCTHGTGGLSSTIRDLTAALPDDVTILDPIGVYRPEVDSSRPAIQEWIAGLNLDI